MAVVYPFVAGAIPGGGPFLLFSVFGWPMETFAAVMALHTITDAPTTAINVVGDLSSGMPDSEDGCQIKKEWRS